MVAFFLRKIVAFSFIISGVCALQARLTKDEEKDILAACEVSSVIKHSKSIKESKSLQSFKKKLDTFFKDKDVRSLFVDRIKNKKYAFNVMRDLQRDNSKYLTIDQKREIILSTMGGQRVWEYLYEPLWKKVAQKYKLQAKQTLSGSSGTFVLKFKDSMYLLKLPAADWHDGESECYSKSRKKYLDPSPYQNISRVFYNHKLRKFIKDQGIGLISVPKKYLYHIPGKPLDVCDDNYIVIAEEYVSLPDILSNNKTLKKIAKPVTYGKTCELSIHPEYVSLVTQLVQVIQAAGLWDIKAHNIFIVDEKGVKKIIITDTEKPGLGGGFDCNFFHKDSGEVWRNGSCGVDCLGKLLS